jgi:micrococcal nuclease
MNLLLKIFLTFMAVSLICIPALSRAEHLTVAYVDDGDTIICENRDITIRVRLVGIDAPEIDNKKNNRQGQPFGPQAKLVLEKLVLHKVVDIVGYGLDDYNRLLAAVNTNGKNINLEMVSQGMAEVYKGKVPKGFNTEPYIKAEQEAKTSSRGIWSQGDSYISPGHWRRTHTELAE